MKDNRVIIYSTTNNNENISVVWRADERFTLEETAKRVVPVGYKYKVIDHSELPTSDIFQHTWEYDFSKSFDGIGMDNIEWERLVYNPIINKLLKK